MMSFVDSSRKTYRSVETNDKGAFSATFSFSVEIPTVVNVAFQAHIINATTYWRSKFGIPLCVCCLFYLDVVGLVPVFLVIVVL